MRARLTDLRPLVAAATLGLLWLPLSAAAAPPDGRFAELPAPDEPSTPDEPSESALASDEAEAQPSSSAVPESDERESDERESDEAESDEAESDEAGPSVVVLDEAKWIRHVIIPGELLGDIADRYQVSKTKLIRWNKLDAKNPKIFAGRKLAVYTRYVPPPRRKLSYTVASGDTWNKVAKAHHVDADTLRTRWNPKVPRRFKAGQTIVIWVDPLADPKFAKSKPKHSPALEAGGASSSVAGSGASSSALAASSLPLVPIPRGSISVGKPNSGKIVNSVRMPENRQLYHLRKPDEAYGSSHALDNLQLAIARWRQATGYAGALKIGAISKKGGGKLKPHSSHRSGRDVDIRLPLEAGKPKGSAGDVNDVDWDALWGLIVALVDTGAVESIYLTSDRQKHLYKAAKRAKASAKTIDRILQYPETGGRRNGIVRHQTGHTAHIHVRFSCAANETRCESY